MPSRFEWAMTILLDVLAVGGVLFGWWYGNDLWLVAGLGFAAMAMGFGHAVKRSEA